VEPENDHENGPSSILSTPTEETSGSFKSVAVSASSTSIQSSSTTIHQGLGTALYIEKPKHEREHITKEAFTAILAFQLCGIISEALQPVSLILDLEL
jgi:hypothetical protein